MDELFVNTEAETCHSEMSRFASLVPADKVLVDAATKYRDFVLQDYEPVCDPSGLLHSSSVLRFALREAGLFVQLWPIIERLRECLGPDETVWGIKRSVTADMLFELYFYNQGVKQKKRVNRLKEILEDLLNNNSTVNEDIPYVMCSLELTKEVAHTREAGGFRIYVGGASEVRRHESFSYLVTGSECRLENHYTYYDMSWELPEVRDRLSFSVHSGDANSQARLLPEELCDCFRIYYSTKPLHDGLYFSRVTTRQLVWFLGQYFPGSLHLMLTEHCADLGHLRWDVAYDFTTTKSNPNVAKIEKVGFYGIV